MPEYIEKDKPISYEIELPIECKKDIFRVIALLSNKESGEIVNAAQLIIDKYETGIKDASEDPGHQIRVVNHKIEVSDMGEVKIFTLDGRNIANENLAPGLYILMLDNRSYKVSVR